MAAAEAGSSKHAITRDDLCQPLAVIGAASNGEISPDPSWKREIEVVARECRT
jgi:hypothetical protein